MTFTPASFVFAGVSIKERCADGKLFWDLSPKIERLLTDAPEGDALRRLGFIQLHFCFQRRQVFIIDVDVDSRAVRIVSTG